jgi:hypothetical protein
MDKPSAPRGESGKKSLFGVLDSRRSAMTGPVLPAAYEKRECRWDFAPTPLRFMRSNERQ